MLSKYFFTYHEQYFCNHLLLPLLPNAWSTHGTAKLFELRYIMWPSNSFVAVTERELQWNPDLRFSCI
jgi:hypothetical protein